MQACGGLDRRFITGAGLEFVESIADSDQSGSCRTDVTHNGPVDAGLITRQLCVGTVLRTDGIIGMYVPT